MPREEEGSDLDVIVRSELNSRRQQQCNGLPNVCIILFRYNKYLVERYTFSLNSASGRWLRFPFFPE